MENFENNLEIVKRLNIEKVDDGDVIWINGLKKEELADVAQEIYRKLEPYDDRDYRKALLSGQSIRPCGAFSIALVYRGGGEGVNILVQNLNAKGIQHATKELLDAVNLVCGVVENSIEKDIEDKNFSQ